MACCTNTYKLGCYEHCKVVTFFNSTVTAHLKAVYSYGNISQEFDIDALADAPIYLYLNQLNENTTYTLKIFDENSNVVTFNVGGIDYDCFEITTKIYSRAGGDFNNDFNNDTNNN